MSWKYLDDVLLRLSKNSTLLGKYWIATVLLLRLVVLTVFGESVWSDEQREFTCNTKQPGCENVCFNTFAPVSNVRMWGLQILAVSVPGSLYFVYVMHVVSRRKLSGDDVFLENDKVKTSDISTSANERVRTANKRWKVLTNHVIPSELHKTRGQCIWRLYLLQIFSRMLIECVFIMLQYTVYFYRWTVPQVFRCQVWPCPHTVDCFISRPQEKTVFFRYMYVISAFSILLSIGELLYIGWIGARRACSHRKGTKLTGRPLQPKYIDEWSTRDIKVMPRGALLDRVSSSECTDSQPPTPISKHEDYVDMQSNNLISYL
ncbi:gap junction beta-2 protein-like [Ciona intestinalis]